MRVLGWGRRFVLVATLCGAAVIAHANPRIDKGRQAYDQGDFLTALVHLDEAAREPSLTEEQLAQIHWYRGASHYALGHRKQATKAFLDLLELRPLYEPGELDAPPDLLALFQDANAHYRERQAVQMSEPRMAGGKLAVDVIRHPDRASSVVVFARAPGEQTFRQFEISVDKAHAEDHLKDAQLWNGSAAQSAIELVVEARSRAGTPLARVGTVKEPYRLAVDANTRTAALAAAARPATDVKTRQPIATPAVAQKSPPLQSKAAGAAPSPGSTLLYGISSLLLVGGGLAVVGTVVSALLSGGSYLGLAALALTGPRGVETTAPYRATLVAYVGGLVVAAALGAFALVLGVGGGAVLAAAIAM